jgi:hypothetical protein
MFDRFLWPCIALMSAALCGALARPPKRVSFEHRPPMLPRIEALRVMGKPWLNLIADYYWIQTIQAVGIAQTVKEYRDIYDYATLTTELDPNFRQPYLFAGTVIAVPIGQGKWANVAESVKLLERGYERFPKYVTLQIILSYSYSTYLKDYRRAGEILREAAKLPGAPPHLGPLATRMFAQAGDFDTALAFATTIAETSEDPDIRKQFEDRVKALHLERVLAFVDHAVASFQEKKQRLPINLDELIREGMLPGAPPDPMGGVIVLDKKGRARSSVQRRRITDFAMEDE